MTITRWLTGFIVLAAIGVGVFFLWPSEERRVRARLDEIAQALSIPAKEGEIDRLARAQRVRSRLGNDIRVDFEHAQWPEISGRDAVAGLVARAWPQTAGGLRVELEELAVSVADDRATADARFKARLRGTDTSGEPSELDGRLVSVTFQKVDGEWLVSSARVLASDDAVR
jgi:ketosteroid isomerase-like protein